MALKTVREKFLEAIEQCQLTKILFLVKQGHNIRMENTFGQNFLVHALQQQNDCNSKKRFQIFQFLITHYNLNIHSFDTHGKNLFNWATNLNCTEEALYLLKSSPGDIDILSRDQTGSCSLHYAVEHGNELLVHAIVNYLLRYRLRFDIKDAYNHTPEDLARKLGYEKIQHFLAQACRSTVFFSREIPPQQQRPVTSKSKSSVPLTPLSLLDTAEYFNLIETRVSLAKNLEDWKTVTALRACKKTNLKKLPNPVLCNTPRESFILPSLPKLRSISTVSQPEQMLRLAEYQLSPSFRRPFVPIYQRTTIPPAGYQRLTSIQRKMSQTSSRYLSSALSYRKRDSDASQISISIILDIQNRVAIPPSYKQFRQPIVTTN